MEVEVARAKPSSRPLEQASVPARRERWAWYLYDFGNSAYAAVILLAVYSAYFKQQVVGGAEGSRLWGLSIGIAILVVGLISPVLGMLADFASSKKRILFFFTVQSCIFTALLFFVQQGDIFIGMLFFILAEIGYRAAQVLYNALLPDIASPDEMGRVSGNGWAVGSLGGIICLAIVLGLIMTFQGQFIVRVAFLIAAAFYALTTMPLFFIVRERTQTRTALAGSRESLSAAFSKLLNAYRSARQHKEFIKFLAAFLIYNNAVMITLDFAGILGAVLFGMNQQQLIIFMMIVQVTSVMGAYVMGQATHRFGGKVALACSIAMMAVVVSGMFIVSSLAAFYVLGALAGFALTAVQSVSRTVVGQVCPVDQSAEYYGLFSVAWQISAFTGPALYGMLATALALRVFQPRGMAVGDAEAAGLQMALIVVIVFLAVGLGMIMSVRSWRRESLQAEGK